MPLRKERKTELIRKYQRKPEDTGSCEVQIALLTERINELTEHCKANRKDRHSRYGLIKLVGQRKRLLSYLELTDSKKYSALIKDLGVRGSKAPQPQSNPLRPKTG